MARRRLHADEVDVDDDLVRALLADQAPAWAGLPLRAAASTGTDSAVYRLGDDLGVRVPRIGWAVPQIAKEREWLPRLAPHLPAAVPEPLLVGAPGRGYPYPWLVYRWVGGEDALVAAVPDWCDLARQVAGFVTALRKVDPAGGPAPRGRAGDVAAEDAATRRAVAGLAGIVDVNRAMAVWDAALAAGPWPGPRVWVHGDLLPGNVLVDGGRLSGVIDWGGACVGDPAVDVMLAWAMPPDARAAYRAALGVDDATWARARGWTVEQAAHFVPYYAETIPDGVAAALRRLHAAIGPDAG